MLEEIMRRCDQFPPPPLEIIQVVLDTGVKDTVFHGTCFARHGLNSKPCGNNMPSWPQYPELATVCFVPSSVPADACDWIFKPVLSGCVPVLVNR